MSLIEKITSLNSELEQELKQEQPDMNKVGKLKGQIIFLGLGLNTTLIR
jgi:hypothetical protein